MSTRQAATKLQTKKGKRNTRQRRESALEQLDAKTELEYLRGDLDDVEALAHAAAEAANELPGPRTPEHRRKVGRVYALVHATFQAVSKLVG